MICFVFWGDVYGLFYGWLMVCLWRGVYGYFMLCFNP